MRFMVNRPITIVVGLLGILGMMPVGASADVTALTTNPFAPRGTALAIPVRIDGARVPDALFVTLEDGRRLEARLARVERRAARAARHWTDEPRELQLTPLERGKPIKPSATPEDVRFLLLAPLPADADGSIRLGRQTLQPVWLDPPTSEYAEPIAFDRRHDRPDTTTPFAYWRWSVLADRRRLAPPPPTMYEPIARLWARHEAGLWAAGLARLAAPHPGIANACRDILTQTCSDDGHRFAAWLADPARTAELLDLLLDPSRTVEQIARDALAWADGIDMTMYWPEDDGINRVRIVIVNATPESKPARLEWAGVVDDLPTAAEVPPFSLRAVTVDRPELPIPGPIRGGLDPALDSEMLFVTFNGRTRTIAFAPRLTPVTPPGLYIVPFRPPLTLAAVQRGAQRDIPLTHRTGAHLRRADRRWELFVECRRPGIAATEAPATLDDVTSPAALAGTESIIVDLRTPTFNPDAPWHRTLLAIPEDGWHRLFDGVHDGTLRIHRDPATTTDTRWTCRIVLPESWRSPVPGVPTLLRLVRTHGDHEGVETTDLPTAPWRSTEATMPLDLTRWRDLPRR